MSGPWECWIPDCALCRIITAERDAAARALQAFAKRLDDHIMGRRRVKTGHVRGRGWRPPIAFGWAKWGKVTIPYWCGPRVIDLCAARWFPPYTQHGETWRGRRFGWLTIAWRVR